MGTPKGLLRLGNQYWLDEQIKMLSVVGINSVVVVLGFHVEQYLAELSWLREGLREAAMSRDGVKVHVALNPDPSRGQFSSLQVGISAFLNQSELDNNGGVFILPVDVPCPSAQVWRELAVAIEKNRTALAFVPRHAGKGGHPILLKRNYLNKLENIGLDRVDESRLDYLLKRLTAGELVHLDLPATWGAAIHRNLNTQEDWKAFCES